MTDPIADMITQIRNGQMAGKRQIKLLFSKLKLAIAEILSAEGYIGKVEKMEGIPVMLTLELKYQGNLPAIRSIARSSKPGHRMYRGVEELPTVLSGYGIAIVSTPQGLITNKEAKKRGIGGEVICTVY